MFKRIAVSLLSAVMFIGTISAETSEKVDTLSVKIYFRDGSTVVDRSYRDNSFQMDTFKWALNRLKNDSECRIISATITGTSSPSGGYSRNKVIADARAASFSKVVSPWLDGTGVKAERVTEVIDWEALADAVAISEVPYKDEVLDIIYNTPVWEVVNGVAVPARKQALEKLHGGASWRYMDRYLFGECRGAIASIAYEVASKSKWSRTTTAKDKQPAVKKDKPTKEKVEPAQKTRTERPDRTSVTDRQDRQDRTQRSSVFVSRGSQDKETGKEDTVVSSRERTERPTRDVTTRTERPARESKTSVRSDDEDEYATTGRTVRERPTRETKDKDVTTSTTRDREVASTRTKTTTTTATTTREDKVKTKSTKPAIEYTDYDYDDYEYREKNPFYMGLKTNLLYYAAALPNIGAEFHVGSNVTLGFNGGMAWWGGKGNGNYCDRIYGGEFDLRWYFGRAAQDKPMTGNHFGAYFMFGTYDVNIDRKNSRGYEGMAVGYQSKFSYNVGLEYGYSLPVARRLNIDFTIGLGYFGGNYTAYYFDKEQSPIRVYLYDNKSNFIGTKAEVSLVWLIGYGNYNKTKRGR